MFLCSKTILCTNDDVFFYDMIVSMLTGLQGPSGKQIWHLITGLCVGLTLTSDSVLRACPYITLAVEMYIIPKF